MHTIPIVYKPQCQLLSRVVAVRAAISDVKSSLDRDLSGLMQTLQADSSNLFTDQGMDLSIYANDVDFQDPITNYSDIEVSPAMAYYLRMYQWHGRVVLI